MKKVLVVLGVLFLVGIGVVVAISLAAKAKFEPYADKVLVQCREGKVEQVYADAAKAFRDSVPLEGFRRYMDVRTKALGAYRRIAKTTGGGISASTSTGTVGSVTANLEYEKGSAEGEFQFLEDGDTWRLIHLKITFDEKLMPAPDRAALEPLSRDLLRLYDESGFVALYARFSKPLQDAWKADAYEKQVRELRAKTGKVVEAKLRETRDEPDKNVTTLFDVTFETGKGDATFGWAWADAEWHLIAFNVHVGPK